MTNTSQDQVFLEGEGNRWFARNKKVISEPARITGDPVLTLLEEAGLRPEAALEVGASNGYRMNALGERYGCRATAVEPSADAIADGRARFPKVTFHQGIASRIPIEGEGLFDLIVINYVFHWVARSALLRSVAEVDRLLKDGGHLILGDFLPDGPQRVRYHHLPDADVWTFKQDYAQLFVGSNLYRTIKFVDHDHDDPRRTTGVDPRSRARVSLLRKSLQQYYPDARMAT